MVGIFGVAKIARTRHSAVLEVTFRFALNWFASLNKLSTRNKVLCKSYLILLDELWRINRLADIVCRIASMRGRPVNYLLPSLLQVTVHCKAAKFIRVYGVVQTVTESSFLTVESLNLRLKNVQHYFALNHCSYFTHSGCLAIRIPTWTTNIWRISEFRGAAVKAVSSFLNFETLV